MASQCFPSTINQPVTAIIGAGVSGISAARALSEYGLPYVIFEKRPSLGGIWTEYNTPVFENLLTNTPTSETCFSNFPPIRTTPANFLHEDDNLFLTNIELRNYLEDVASNTHGLKDNLRLSTQVVSVIRSNHEGFVVEFITQGCKISKKELYQHVIIASGFYHTPMIPIIHGLDTTNLETIHVSQYKNPAQFAGKRVLVVGGSVSGCEAAGDLAHSIVEQMSNAPKSVTINSRIMRAVFTKQKNGRAITPFVSTRYHAIRKLANRYGDQQHIDDTKKLIDLFSRNEDYGIPPINVPLKMPMFPGWTVCTWRLLEASRDKLVKWRISGIEQITNDGVKFKDGVYEEYDAIIFATGYTLQIPYLEEDMLDRVLKKDARSLPDLYDYTFHPHIKGMAFIGLFPPANTVIPMTEMQSRWVASVFAGETSLPSDEEMMNSIEEYVLRRHAPESYYVVFSYEILDRFAKKIGCEMDLAAFPELTKGLLLGPIVSAQFRIFGPHRFEGAKDICVKQLAAAGFIEGDNKVDEDVLNELQIVSSKLDGNVDAPKGLKEAIDYLVKVNLGSTN